MADTKTLVRQLQHNPKDLALLRTVKKQMLSERRLTGLAQLVEWWAKRAPSPRTAAQELYEVGVALESRPKYKERALALYELAVSYHPEHAAARARITVLRPDEEFDALMNALESDSIHPPPGQTQPANASLKGSVPAAPTSQGATSPKSSLPATRASQGSASPHTSKPGPYSSQGPQNPRTGPPGRAPGDTAAASSGRSQRAGQPQPSLGAGRRNSSMPAPGHNHSSHPPIPSLRSAVARPSTVPPLPAQPLRSAAAAALTDAEPPPISSPAPPPPQPHVSSPLPPSNRGLPTGGSTFEGHVDEDVDTSPQQQRIAPADAATGQPNAGPRLSPAPQTRPVISQAPATKRPTPAPPLPGRATTPASPEMVGVAPPDGFEPALYDDDAEEDADHDRSGARFAVGAILAEPPANAAQKGGATRLEVVRSRGDAVMGVSQVRLWGRGGSENLRMRRVGLHTYQVKPPAGASGFRKPVGGSSVAVGEQPFRLDAGDIAEVTANGVVHRLRLIQLSKPPAVVARELPVKRYATALATGILIHLLGVLAVVVMHSQGVTFVVDDRPREEIFAEAKLAPPPDKKKPKIRKPKRIKLRKRTKPDKPAPSEERAKIPNSMRKRLKKIARSRARSNKNSVDRLVSALTSPHAGEGKTVKEVVSNIEAVKGGERSAAFRVGGTLAAIEGVGPNIASGGGGQVGTLGGKEATGSLERLTGPKRKGGVRGKVATVSALAKVQGSLSRSEVLKVLNQNQRKVVRCYERALTSKPNLSGKLTFTWTIKPNGRVGSVRQAASTLGHNGVSKCISGVIKRMRFPKPKGGSVSITFPWIFTRAR